MVTHDRAIAAQADRTVRLAAGAGRGRRLGHPPRRRSTGLANRHCGGSRVRTLAIVARSRPGTPPVDPRTAFKVYINGKLFDKDDAKISVYDHGLLYGDGVFEGMRSYGGKVFRLEEHLTRLWNSAKAIRLEIPMSREADGPRGQRDAARPTSSSDGYIRLIVTRGAGSLGLDPNRTADPQVIIITDQITLYPDELYGKGLEIITASTLRNHPAALNPRIKSLNYLNNILAKIEGMQAGCIEALMLNHKGEVAECTGDNIFLVRDGVLLTPPIDAGILEGITRDAVIELARAVGPRSARSAAHPARRLHRRRVLSDRHRRRGDPRGQGRQPHDRHRQARPDHPRFERALSQADAQLIPAVSRRNGNAIRRNQLTRRRLVASVSPSDRLYFARALDRPQAVGRRHPAPTEIPPCSALRFTSVDSVFLAGLAAALLRPTATTGRNGAGRIATACGARTGLLDKFADKQLKIRWRQPYRSGYSGPDRGRRPRLRDRSRGRAASRSSACTASIEKTGKPLWTHSYDCAYDNVGYTAGPRASVTIDDGRAYSLGSMGHLFCFDAATGKVLWSKDLQQRIQDSHADLGHRGLAAWSRTIW